MLNDCPFYVVSTPPPNATLPLPTVSLKVSLAGQAVSQKQKWQKEGHGGSSTMYARLYVQLIQSSKLQQLNHKKIIHISRKDTRNFLILKMIVPKVLKTCLLIFFLKCFFQALYIANRSYK